MSLEQIADATTRKRILTLHPVWRDEVAAMIVEVQSALQTMNGIRMTYGLRTFAQQDALWQKGRDAKGNKIGPTVTNARGGQSYHNYGLAFDFVLMHPDGKISWSLREDLDNDGLADWIEAAHIFKSHGCEWGGEWSMRDNPHVQKRFGMHWKDMLRLHNTNKVDANGYIII